MGKLVPRGPGAAGNVVTLMAMQPLRCPFAGRPDHMPACPGYLVETVGGDQAQTYPFHAEASTCAHLAPQELSRGRLVPVCDHPEAAWIVPTVRRIRGAGLVRAEVTGPRGGGRHAPAMADRASQAQLRAASLCGTTQALVLLSHLRRRARTGDDLAALVPGRR